MDSYNHIGKIKEQISKEHQARRNFAKKWIKLADPELNKFYNQDEINKQLKELLKTKDLCPYIYTGHGDSYFVSREMYNSLLAKCRCARPRSEAHMLTCVQKEKNKYLSDEMSNDDAVNEEAAVKTVAKNYTKMQAKKTLPETSNAFVGWQRRQPAYKQWEASMKYISPVSTMPGPRVTATSYNVLFIG